MDGFMFRPIMKLTDIPEWIWNRIIIVAYLIINGDTVAAEAVKFAPNAKFFDLVSKHVDAYVKEGVIPPEPIATAIINFADNLMADGTMTIRTGDYIAIQNFLRQRK